MHVEQFSVLEGDQKRGQKNILEVYDTLSFAEDRSQAFLRLTVELQSSARLLLFPLQHNLLENTIVVDIV